MAARTLHDNEALRLFIARVAPRVRAAAPALVAVAPRSHPPLVQLSDWPTAIVDVPVAGERGRARGDDRQHRDAERSRNVHPGQR
jgi:hypothetical protein